jgi:hypothetical protein
VFETGSKTGAAVAETSKQEKRFVDQGQGAIEHCEEQP